ncbi:MULTISPECIES: S24/S26 family peptidase [Methanothermobacter]|uniref:S26 family signal peptidase n=1 Tax=Methanothermobacter thermautotrophicus TaxID=145262 RepID=A0A7J4MX78_METTF|nr:MULTISPECIES: S24/S26 family peptidase [Methanothermobacter]NLU04572.1 S26 family signal peptidase [Methanothermobacter sp.]WBF08616.1 S26 family signal peptidase [Methanothermobacter thermautotrophicus]BAM69742.1 putative peptidase [Methanothermobacter sp. CaT2]HIH65267.1 S26 family signal peptidase [Methanothermobacter thermautotrophicus]HIH71246.1 S26 family signal peptidase [Methanothermobacter thermautotrophicus]
MKKVLIAIAVLAIIAVSGAFYYLDHVDSVDITIKTDGVNITVEADTIFFQKVPAGMEQEIGDYMADVINDPDSTVESIKKDVTDIAERYGYREVNVRIESQFGVDQLPMPAVVSGDSMYPTLKDGQDLIVLKTDRYSVGDIVIARHPEYGLIVKRVGKIEPERVYLMSDNKKVERIYTPTSVIVRTPLNTWVPRSAIVGVVKEY